MSLVLKEAGPTISIFQVHTPYCALCYLPIEPSGNLLHLNVIHCNSLLSLFTCILCHNNSGGLGRTERVHGGRKGKGKGRSVRGRFSGCGSRDGLIIITSPSVESVMAGSTVGRRRDAVGEPASSRLQVPESVLYNW